MRAYRSVFGLPNRILLTFGVSVIAITGAQAGDAPKGGVVAKGQAQIATSAARTTIRQNSNRAVIDWDGFDVGADHSVVFEQPGKSSATLNRVKSTGRSVIAGAIKAPGTVVIQNNAGVLFTSTARIDTGSLVATSQTVDADTFQRDGALRIGGGEATGARVKNEGRITIGQAGLAALVGGDVENAGAIVAHEGTVALASGARTAIDFSGDGVISFVTSGDGSGGVRNHGLIEAPDGRVVLTAGAAARTLDAAINTTGVIRATSATGDGGRVDLIGRGTGKVRIAGALDVSGAGRGGSVTATGQTLDIAASARIDASGGRDGGTVRLGGDRRGTGPMRRAEHLTFAPGATVSASGATGRGGSVVLWSDGATRANGAIRATGPVAGGFVETSGAMFLGVGAKATVAVGAGGQWLLDPRDIVIGNSGSSPIAPGTTTPPPGATPFVIDRNAIASTLNAGGDVTLSTVQPASTMAGDITVSGPLTWTGAGALRLEAERDITFNLTVQAGAGGLVASAGRDIASNTTLRGSSGDVTLSAGRNISTSGAIEMTGDGNLLLDAGGGITINQIMRALGDGDITLLARTGDLRVTENPTTNMIVSADSGRLRLEATQGSILLRRVNPKAGANIQIFSLSGGMDLVAGTRILLEGGEQGGRWVRVGRDESSSDVTLTAPDITIQGGSKGNTFAKVVTGPGGSITMDAKAITVQNGAGDQGRIFALRGANLTLRGETQIWNGPVRAGSGSRDGGNVTVAGAVTADFEPMFSLAPDRNFVFLPEAPRGTRSSYTSGEPFVVNTSGRGAIDIDAPVIARQILLESEERVGLGPSGSITGEGPGDALVIAAGRQFRNASRAGAAALETPDPDARWLLYIDTFSGLAGPAPRSGAPDLYGRTYRDTPPPRVGFEGNRVLYGERPILTLTGETLSKTYGSLAKPGFVMSGLRPGDNLATALEAGPSVTSDGAPAAANVGGYATVVAAQASDQGYILDLSNGLLTVDPAALTVTANDAARGYGAGNPAFSAGFSGFVLGQSVTDLGGALTVQTTATPASNVGSYAITAAGLTSSNYAITYANGALSVDPARLVVTPTGTRTYGSLATTDTSGFEGFVLGQDRSALGGNLVFQTAANAASNVGTYAATGTGFTSGNYAISYAPGSVAITPAPLTVTANDAARSYGSANPPLSADFEGFVLGQSVADLAGSLTVQTTATPASIVGSYAITAAGLTSGNYAITYANGALTVNPAALTVRPGATRTYGSLATTDTTAIDGFVLGQGVGDLSGTLAFQTPATVTSNAGAYTLVASGLASQNYAITYAPGTLTIDRAPLSITANDASRSYGAANPALTAGLAGFVLGQSVTDLAGSLTVQTTATPASNVGSYAITAAGLTSSNYTITYANGALSVDPARLVVTPTGTRTYGSLATTDTSGFEGFVLGQDRSALGGALVFQTAANAASNVGTYAATGTGFTSGNYAISYAPGSVSINPAPLTVAANDATRLQGAPNPAFSADFAGFVLGEDTAALTGALGFTTGANAASGPGSYTLTPGGLTGTNYAIVFVDGLLTVAPNPAPPAADPLASIDQSIDFARGVPPFTPGDAAFRTTQSEAAPSLQSPFALTYSLGQVTLLAPPGEGAPAAEADTGGFAPAAGGFSPAAGETGTGSGTCSGQTPNLDGLPADAPMAACTQELGPESFWTTAFPQAAQ